MVWVRTYSPLASQWIDWPAGWAMWRFGQRAPEMVGFRDVEDVQHREAM